MKNILDLTEEEAEKFFLKSTSYANIGFPPYFDFNPLLNKIADIIEPPNSKDNIKKEIKIFPLKNTKNLHKEENVNYTIWIPKSIQHDYRKLQLIHPFLYTLLVKEITEKGAWEIIKARFKQLKQKSPNIECCSIPCIPQYHKTQTGADINQWLEKIETQSIALSLEYSFYGTTDIANCYDSIYTHTIAWALHGKKVAKKKKQEQTLIGNKIDFYIGCMSQGQTNGIPTGSVLMDFIAEMVLAYGDGLILYQIKQYNRQTNNNRQIKDFKILRYRDDYRIFTKSEDDLKNIIGIISTALSQLNFKLNNEKTHTTNISSKEILKPDKWLFKTRFEALVKNTKEDSMQLFERLLLTSDFNHEFPGGGQVIIHLQCIIDYIENITPNWQLHEKNIKKYIALVVEVMRQNPRIYLQGVVVLSKLLYVLINREEIVDVVSDAYKALKSNRDTAVFDIWWQRVLLAIDIKGSNKEVLDKHKTEEKLCKLVLIFYKAIKKDSIKQNTKHLWNSKWIVSCTNAEVGKEIEAIFEKMDLNLIFNQSKMASLTILMLKEEYNIFHSAY